MNLIKSIYEILNVYSSCCSHLYSDFRKYFHLPHLSINEMKISDEPVAVERVS